MQGRRIDPVSVNAPTQERVSPLFAPPVQCAVLNAGKRIEALNSIGNMSQAGRRASEGREFLSGHAMGHSDEKVWRMA